MSFNSSNRIDNVRNSNHRAKRRNDEEYDRNREYEDKNEFLITRKRKLTRWDTPNQKIPGNRSNPPIRSQSTLWSISRKIKKLQSEVTDLAGMRDQLLGYIDDFDDDMLDSNPPGYPFTSIKSIENTRRIKATVMERLKKEIGINERNGVGVDWECSKGVDSGMKKWDMKYMLHRAGIVKKSKMEQEKKDEKRQKPKYSTNSELFERKRYGDKFQSKYSIKTSLNESMNNSRYTAPTHFGTGHEKNGIPVSKTKICSPKDMIGTLSKGEEVKKEDDSGQEKKTMSIHEYIALKKKNGTFVEREISPYRAMELIDDGDDEELIYLAERRRIWGLKDPELEIKWPEEEVEPRVRNKESLKRRRCHDEEMESDFCRPRKHRYWR